VPRDLHVYGLVVGDGSAGRSEGSGHIRADLYGSVSRSHVVRVTRRIRWPVRDGETPEVCRNDRERFA